MRSTLLISALALSCLGIARAQTVALVPPSSAVKFETGVSYSRGDYGLAQDTTVWVIPSSLTYESGRWVFRATVPWVTIKGPATVVGDGAAATAGPIRPTSSRESGTGDSLLSVTYKLNPGANRLNFDLTGRVKLPTGNDERGIGTGETDTYAQIDLYQDLGLITPFGSLGYRWLGSGRYQLEDGSYASGGLLFNLTPSTSVGTAVEWRDRLVANGKNSTEASLFAFHRFADRWNSTFSVLKGFTDASPDYGFSTQVSYTF